MQYSLRSLLLCVLLTVMPNANAGVDPPTCLLASCIEQGMHVVPLVVYEFEFENGGLTEVMRFRPYEGVRMVRANETCGAIAVWGYADERDEANPEGTGVLWLATRANAWRAKSVEIPYHPVLGGYFYTSDTGAVAVYTRGLSAGPDPAKTGPILWDGEQQAGIMVSYGGVPWLSLQDEGCITPEYSGYKGYIDLRIDAETGRFSAVDGPDVVELDWRLTGDTLTKYRMLLKRGQEITQKAPEDLRFGPRIAVRSEPGTLVFITYDNDFGGAAAMLAFDPNGGVHHTQQPWRGVGKLRVAAGGGGPSRNERANSLAT